VLRRTRCEEGKDSGRSGEGVRIVGKVGREERRRKGGGIVGRWRGWSGAEAGLEKEMSEAGRVAREGKGGLARGKKHVGQLGEKRKAGQVGVSRREERGVIGVRMSGDWRRGDGERKEKREREG